MQLQIGLSGARRLQGGPQQHGKDRNSCNWTFLLVLLSIVLFAAVAVQTIVISQYRQQLSLVHQAHTSTAINAVTEASAALVKAQEAVVAATSSAEVAIKASNAALSYTQASVSMDPLHPSATAALPTLAPVLDRPGVFALHTSTLYHQRIAQQERTPSGAVFPSGRFTPMRISTCLEHMPRHWAPCAAATMKGLDFEYAEEVVYPPTKVRIPGFVSTDDAQRWLAVIGTRGLAPKEGGVYIPIHTQGQNYVLRNVRYTDNPFPDNWSAQGTHVMGHNSEIIQFQSTSAAPEDRLHEELFIVNTPQAFSYQHFSDHVFKVIMQGRHMITNNTDIIAGQTSVASVKEVWSWFPVNQSRVIWGKQPSHFARRLMYACRTPFWGAYNTQRWAEEVLGPGASLVPMADRKVVLYYSRSVNGKQQRNSASRRVTNEAALLEAITALLARRAAGETLVVMDFGRFKTYRDWVTWVNRNVRAFVGPHGGGMLNIQWMARDTLVVEFQHHSHINYAMWEFSPFLEQNYWNLQYTPSGSGTDMEVDVAAVVKLLDSELGRVAPPGHYLEHDYEWLRALQGA